MTISSTHATGELWTTYTTRTRYAFIPGNAEPIYGREAHGAAMQQLARMFPDVRVHTPYPIQSGGEDEQLAVVSTFEEGGWWTALLQRRTRWTRWKLGGRNSTTGE